MEEQDMNVIGVTIAHDTRKKARKYKLSKTSFFCLDKNYRQGEYDKTNKVLSLSQTENTPTRKNGTLYLCDHCNKK